MKDTTFATHIAHGSVISESIDVNYTHPSTSVLQTSYIYTPPIQTNTFTPIEDYITSSIKSTNNTGMYELSIITHVQNGSGANRWIKNLLTLLHEYQEIQLYLIAGVNPDKLAIYCTRFS